MATINPEKLAFANAVKKFLKFLKTSPSSVFEAEPNNDHQIYVVSRSMGDFEHDFSLDTVTKNGNIEITKQYKGKIAKVVYGSYDAVRDTLDVFPNDKCVLGMLDMDSAMVFTSSDTPEDQFIQTVSNFFFKQMGDNFKIIYAKSAHVPRRTCIRVSDIPREILGPDNAFYAPFGTQHISEDYIICIEPSRTVLIGDEHLPWFVAIDSSAFFKTYNVLT